MRDKPWNVEPYVTQERTRIIHYGIGAICFSRITDEDRHDILHRNAERLLEPFLAGGQ